MLSENELVAAYREGAAMTADITADGVSPNRHRLGLLEVAKRVEERARAEERLVQREIRANPWPLQSDEEELAIRERVKADVERESDVVPSFAEQISAFRRARNLTQEALARALGVSFATVNRWESGSHEPDPAALARQRRREHRKKLEEVKQSVLTMPDKVIDTEAANWRRPSFWQDDPEEWEPRIEAVTVLRDGGREDEDKREIVPTVTDVKLLAMFAVWVEDAIKVLDERTRGLK